jgi:anti-anti-sigma factor
VAEPIERLTLVAAEEDDLIRVDCSGEISQIGLRPGDDPLAGVLPAGGYGRKVLMNLDKTTYIDSSGVSWLIMAHRRFAQAGGKLVIYAVPPLVLQVLQLLRMTTLLNIAPDEAAARALVAGDK